MENLIVAAFRALRSLFTPGMFGLFMLCILATVGVLFCFVGSAAAFFNWLGAHQQSNPIGPYLGAIGSFGSAIIAWFLFPGIMPVIVSFFDERIAHTIEQHDYPATPAAISTYFLPELFHDLRFAAIAILFNILVLPLYLFAALIPFVFYGLNGWLLGREFFLMAARRHLPIHEAETLRRNNRFIIMTVGVLLTVFATIPVMNLFAPFWGIAVMVHLYHRLAGTEIKALNDYRL